MLFISPPFGNYIYLPYTKRIKGSYTLIPRSGLFFQIIKTLRYSPTYGGWINKIGLRNQGLKYGIENYNPKTDILSIAILERKEIEPILKILPDETNIELNVSCPNLKKHMINKDLHKFINPKREWCIIKLPPTVSIKDVRSFYNEGFRQFHCANTLPVKNGGVSGQILIPYVSNVIRNITKEFPDTTIIAGGGIQTMETLKWYKKLGADHYSISTLFFNPFKTIYFFNQYYK